MCLGFSVMTSYSTAAWVEVPCHSPLLWPPGMHGLGPGLFHTFQRSLSRSGPSGSAWRGRQRVPKSPVSSRPLIDHPGAAEVNNIFVWMWNGQDKVGHSGLEP